MLTVEYVDDSAGMDAAIKSMDSRLQQVEKGVNDFQERQNQLIAAVNEQAKQIARYMDSIRRRIDHIYKRVLGTDPGTKHGSLDAAGDELADSSEAELPLTTLESGLSPDVADDPEHQNAWRIARVLAADLEAYHEELVMEGVLYGTFYKVLREPIEQARKTYEDRVAPDIVENYDYFSKALDELIARKRMESDAGSAI
jgi:hypothetical protein